LVSIGICGLRGSGKTAFATLLGYVSFKHGNKVYTNYKTKFSEVINPVDFMKFNYELNNCTIILDEIYAYLDSYISGNRGEREFSYYFNQARKRNVNFIYTSQLLSSVNSRITRITEYVFTSEAIYNKKGEIDRFVYQRWVESMPIGNPIVIPFRKMMPILNMYDTYEIVYPSNRLEKYDVSVDDLKSLFESSKTKRAFVSIVRKRYPFLIIQDAEAIYDLLRIGNYEAIKLLIS